MQRTSRISFVHIFGQFGFRFYVMGHQSTQNIFLLKYWADIPRDQGSPKRPSTLIIPIKLSPSPDLRNPTRRYCNLANELRARAPGQ